MKDYSLNNDDRKRFILSYVVENGTIVAKLASGEEYVVSYSEENEQNILNRMKNQANNAIDKEYKINNQIKKSAIWSCVMLLLIIANAFIYIFDTPSMFTYLALTLGSLSFVLDSAQVITNLIKKKEIEKLKYFLDNEQMLNDNVRKNENIFSRVNNKTVQKIQQTPMEKPVFDINTIDNYKLTDLKILRDNIKREFVFGFNQYQAVDSDIKGQSKVLKRQNKNQDN